MDGPEIQAEARDILSVLQSRTSWLQDYAHRREAVKGKSAGAHQIDVRIMALPVSSCVARTYRRAETCYPTARKTKRPWRPVARQGGNPMPHKISNLKLDFAGIVWYVWSEGRRDMTQVTSETLAGSCAKGAAAYHAGEPRDSNPYPLSGCGDRRLQNRWYSGWWEAEQAARRQAEAEPKQTRDALIAELTAACDTCAEAITDVITMTLPEATEETPIGRSWLHLRAARHLALRASANAKKELTPADVMDLAAITEIGAE